jgi:hypothetical protein
MCLAQTWHIPGVSLPWTSACPAVPPAPGQGRLSRTAVLANQVTIRPPRRRYPHRAASPPPDPAPGHLPPHHCRPEAAAHPGRRGR